MKFLYSLILLGLSFSLFSQRSKDGVGTISAANTIVNAYTSLTADANAGSSTINVANSASFSVGDLVLIVQMQGTKVNAFWEEGVFNDPNNSTANPSATNLNYGSVLDYYTCGNNEFAEVTSIPNGTSITLDCSLTNSYTYSVNINVTGSWGNHTAYGNVQVIKVPRYSSLTVNAGGSITCPQWNGTTGGVVAVEVENNTTLSNSPSIDVSGKGFRGGIKDNASSVFGGNKWGAANRDQGGYKGESIAGDTTIYKNYAALIGRGAIANGGGGGNAHNCGGGGGANGGVVASYNGFGNPIAGFNTQWNLEGASFATNTSSGGGRGGYSFSNSNQSVTTKAPGNTSWGGDNRRNFGGFGGRPLDYSTGRIYLGGGGGAGDGNENRAGAGGNGGGIVFLVCYGNLSGAGTIIADGANGLNSSPGCASNDGAGGGGGGGTILLKVNGTISLTASTALSAVGGNGGNVNFSCGALPNADGYGPGGSGGGGYIASTGTLPSNNVIAGTNGIQTGNTSNITNNFPPNGATRGGSGSTGSITAYTLNASANQTLCTNQSFTLTASSTEPSTSISWYNTIVGGSAIATGTAYTSPGYGTTGTYTLFAGACSGTYRQPIILTVTAGLNITVNSPTICPTQTVVLTANGATTYTWVTGSPNSSTLSVSPSSTTIYTVNGTTGTCVGTKTAAVIVSAVPSLTVANASICSGNNAILSASGASSYTLSPSTAFTSTVSVNPTTTTNYTITGSNGACTNTIATIVNVTSTPTITGVANTTICPTQTVTLTASGANSFTWQPNSFVGSTYTIAPASNTTVSVIGANGTCTSSATASITIGTGISITVNSPTICVGQTASLTANGATTYTWNTGPNTSTLNISPTSTTVYTISGTSGSCSGLNTATVNVVGQPTISVADASICSGSSATLTASGATNYTWSPGGQTSTSIIDNPNTTSIYTITGTNGICTNTTTATINITATPTLVANSVTICPSQTATLSANGATTYTWNPGNASGSTYTIAPASNTVVSVVGANGTCTSSATASITIGTGISISVNSETICAGQTASLTASGATSYTWNTGPTTNTINVNPTSTTIYTINGSSGSCNGVNTATVTVNTVPTLTVNTGAICIGESATLTASGANTYTWDSGANTNSINVSPASTTIYTVTGTALNGCTSSTTTPVTVTAIPSISVNPSSICSGQTATLTATGSATSFTWSTTENTQTINPTPVTTTTYIVTGNNGGCSNSYTTTVTVDNIVLSTYSLAVSTCPTETVALFGTGTNSATTTYTWSNGVNTFSQTVAPINTTTYVVNGTSLSGCPALSGTVIVNVNSISASFSGLNSTIMSVDETLNLTNTSTGASSILWDYCNGISTNSVITIPLADTGSCCIKLVATNATCKDSVTKCVTIITDAVVVIPNVFTPNGDTKNDLFKISSTGLKSLNCVIYDRWGLKMYEWDGINGFWDGNSKTGTAPDGTYFYIINYTDLRDKTVTEKGYLNLFK